MIAAGRLVLAAVFLGGAACAAHDEPQTGDVHFATADGLTIAATYWPPIAGTPSPAPVVIALPMYGCTRTDYVPMVGPVTDRGMGFLALDLRGHGASAKQGGEDLSKRVEARDPALFNAMHLDVEAAVAWLVREKKAKKGAVGLLGASVGCSVAIDAAVRNADDVAAVACLTPGRDYLGVPTMEHVANWPAGKPLLAVSSAAESEGGAAPIAAKLGAKVCELKIVAAGGPDKSAGETDLHGTNMFGRVPDVENNVADWLAYRLAFRRVELGDGAVAVIGSTGDALYVGVELTGGSKAALGALTVRVGTGDVTNPWSKAQIVEVGKRLVPYSPEAPTRRRTKLDRERLGVAAGQSFAVAVSVDGRNFLPESAAPALFFTLR